MGKYKRASKLLGANNQSRRDHNSRFHGLLCKKEDIKGCEPNAALSLIMHLTFTRVCHAFTRKNQPKEGKAEHDSRWIEEFSSAIIITMKTKVHQAILELSVSVTRLFMLLIIDLSASRVISRLF